METSKGFQDFSGEDALKRERIVEIIVETFKLYGFEPAETPVIEYEEFVRGSNMQDEAISDVFRLQDKGKRNLALRYEFTFQLKRLAKNKKLPYKRYQIGVVFRDEPVSANRFRQITQCDADIVGSTLKDEAEILAMVKRIFQKLGLSIIIYVNNRKLLNEIIREQGITAGKIQQVIKEIDKIDKLPEKQLQTNLKKYGAEKILSIFKKPKRYFEKFISYKEIQQLEKYCKLYGVKIEFLPSLARGLSYYTGNVFEIKTNNLKETIAAGGTYLIDSLQCTGISLGLERVASLVKMKVAGEKILIVSIGQDEKAIKLAEKLRDEKIAVQIWSEKGISKALEYANSLQIPYVIFFGEEEFKLKKFKLRNMSSGKEKMLSETELIKELKG